MAYADKDQLIADYIPEAKSTTELAAIGRILDNVSAFVDTYCRRTPGYFDPAADDASERRFRGDGENFLRLPVHVTGSVEQVTIDGQVIDTSNYYESDRNGWLYREDAVWLVNEGFTPYQLWEAGRTFKVTARWGYEATPVDLTEAVRQFVARIWETQKGVLGQITPDGFIVERAMPLTVREILDKYKRREFEI